MKSRTVSLFVLGILLALLLAACSSPIPTSREATATSNAIPACSTQTPLDYGMMDVGGYELFFQSIGQGTPTVILEAGASSGAGYWLLRIAGRPYLPMILKGSDILSGLPSRRRFPCSPT